MKLEDIKNGMIVECHLAGYWIVEGIVDVGTAEGEIKARLVKLRLVINGAYRSLPKSKKTRVDFPEHLRQVFLSDVTELRRKLNSGINTLEAYVKESPSYKGLLKE